MAAKTIDLEKVLKAVESLREHVAGLEQRLVALEANLAKAPSVSPSRPAEADRLIPELMMVIGAAVAAFLGVKPHIRQIRLVSGVPWPLQGRVTIQGSHWLHG